MCRTTTRSQLLVATSSFLAIRHRALWCRTTVWRRRTPSFQKPLRKPWPLGAAVPYKRIMNLKAACMFREMRSPPSWSNYLRRRPLPMLGLPTAASREPRCCASRTAAPVWRSVVARPTVAGFGESCSLRLPAVQPFNGGCAPPPLCLPSARCPCRRLESYRPPSHGCGARSTE